MSNRRILLPVLALAAAAGVWWFNRDAVPSGTPAATWRVGAGTDFHQGIAYESLAAETPIRLSFHCSEPRHVYVFSLSAEDGTILMWPSHKLRSNLGTPLPSGRSVLPGERDGEELAWTTRHQILATTTYVVVASAAPVPELEELLPRLRCWSNSSLTDGTMVVTMPGGDAERIGMARTDWPSALLRRAAERGVAEAMVNGPMHPDSELADVWTSSWRVKEIPGTADTDKMFGPLPVEGPTDPETGKQGDGK